MVRICILRLKRVAVRNKKIEALYLLMSVKHKFLPQVRKKLLDEFQFNTKTISLLENQLGQEPHNIVTNQDGTRRPSNRWSCMVEKIWAWNNTVPDAKGRQNFEPYITIHGHTFNRRDIMQESVFRVDLHNLIRSQFKDLGYYHCFKKDIWRTDYSSNEQYKTMLIQVRC